jgi:hypothetical protein
MPSFASRIAGTSSHSPKHSCKEYIVVRKERKLNGKGRERSGQDLSFIVYIRKKGKEED